ncbi:hypothetical protein LK416_08335 [Lachnospiraceae bacterium GAM79]|jgi:hypothetical protein|nr:hypothetical protein LK416_08335 [Lachnospiraceae bacterium GAM79]UEA76876.1 hypothetical protein LK424_11670 [Lachnospiraceae bacterium GAM79]
MKRIKKLLSLLITFTLIFTMSGVVYAAADDTATISAYEKTDKKVAELSAATCTIKKNDNKYYYKNASGKTDKKTGWKKNQNGQYVYYVGSKGYVTEKISGGYWYHFSGKKFVKKSLSSYKNKAKTIGKKIFFVNSKGKIVLKSGWKKVSGVYTYYVSKTGTASVKLTGKKYYKVSGGAFKAQSLAKYKNDRVKIHGKYFYVDKNGSMIRTAKTVKSGNYKFTIKADGTCTKTKIETKTPDSSNSGKSDNTGENNNGKTDDTIPAHTHQWSPLAEDHTMLKDTNYVKHDAVVENVYKEIKPAWDEKIWEDKTVCLTCVWNKKPKEGEEWTDLDGDGVWTAPVEGWVYFPECVIDYEKHKKETGHTKPTETRVVTGITHHPAEYAYVPTTITPEWSECDMNVRCTVCNEMMKIHVVRTYDPYSVKCTPEKSGDLVNIYGKKYASVTAGVSYED